MAASALVRKSLLPAVALAAALAGYWLAQSLSRPVIPANGGVAAGLIEFTLPDLDGKPRNIREWQGKLIVLNFWATWCPPCREEIPVFIDLQKRYGALGLQIVGVAIDRRDAVVAYRDAAVIDYPLLIGEDDALAIMSQYGNRLATLPYSVVIAPDGRVTSRKLGAYTRIELEGLIAPHLPATAPPTG